MLRSSFPSRSGEICQLRLLWIVLVGLVNSSWALDDTLEFNCKACYVFRVHREPTTLLGSAPPQQCGLSQWKGGVPVSSLPKHVTLVADSLYTLKDSNIFHVSGSLFRMFLMLYDLNDKGIRSTVIVPDMWNSSSWVQQLFFPYLGELGATLEFRSTREKFCVPGVSVVPFEHVPYVPEQTLLVRNMMERACKINLFDRSGPPLPDVLILNRPTYLARKRYISNVLDLEEQLKALGASYVHSSVPPTPCEQIKLIAREHKVIITPHGTHMANFLALSPRTAVIEVNPPRFLLPLFCRLRSSLNIPWFHFISSNHGREAFVYANCSHPDDMYVLPGCTATGGFLPRCLDSPTRDREVHLTPRDLQVMKGLVGSLLVLQGKEYYADATDPSRVAERASLNAGAGVDAGLARSLGSSLGSSKGGGNAQGSMRDSLRQPQQEQGRRLEG